jgi:hypothetical protein
MKHTIINGLIAGLSTSLLAACGSGADTSNSNTMDRDSGLSYINQFISSLGR